MLITNERGRAVVDMSRNPYWIDCRREVGACEHHPLTTQDSRHTIVTSYSRNVFSLCASLPRQSISPGANSYIDDSKPNLAMAGEVYLIIRGMHS